MNDFDDLLRVVSLQARSAGVPISRNIDPHIRVNTRAKRRFGQCKKTGDRFTIELSSVLLNAPEQSARQTIAHELIHTCRGCFDHGDGFNRYADIMNRRYGYNISRTNSPEEMGVEGVAKEAKYIIRCKSCGNKIYRLKMSPLLTQLDKARCGACGGELELIKGELPAAAAAQPKYIVICTGCGIRIPRERMCSLVKYTSRYRCGKCGGKLKRII